MDDKYTNLNKTVRLTCMEVVCIVCNYACFRVTVVQVEIGPRSELLYLLL